MALLRDLTRLPNGTVPLANPESLAVLASDVAPLRRLNTESSHDLAIADSALRILNNVLLIHEDLRGPFADSPPLPGIGGAAHVLNMLSPVAALLESIFFPQLCGPV